MHVIVMKDGHMHAMKDEGRMKEGHDA